MGSVCEATGCSYLTSAGNDNDGQYAWLQNYGTDASYIVMKQTLTDLCAGASYTASWDQAVRLGHGQHALGAGRGSRTAEGQGAPPQAEGRSPPPAIAREIAGIAVEFVQSSFVRPAVLGPGP